MNEQANMFPETTPGGFDIYEVKSALQKSVRRCLEEDALFWMAELAKWNPESLWTTLKVIASEDIGLASPSAALAVRALYENWREIPPAERDAGDGRIFITHAVLILVRANTSRITDDTCILAFGGGLVKREIPDYALDEHTKRGRAMGRGQKHFFEDGAKLENCNLPDVYEARAKALCIAAEQKKRVG